MEARRPYSRSTSRSPGTYGRIGSTFRPILEPPAPISFASVDPRDRSPSGYLLGAAVWGEKAHHPPAPIIGGTNQHVHPERTHLLSEQRIGRLATANRPIASPVSLTGRTCPVSYTHLRAHETVLE